MADTITLENEGFLEIQWPVPGQQNAGIQVDIEISSERLIKATNEAMGDPVKWTDLLKNELIAIGLPSHLSHYNYHRVARRIWDAQEALLKKDAAIRLSGDDAGSPGTTS